ncbi:zinc-finger homeodomain protein [Salix suchowensis]|nr:zinc-finger homeodomain protein [Salix suchowensis]
MDQSVKYRECMRNHAASIGGHANDGCGEFMPHGDDEGTRDWLTCAACGCHRNFHRRQGSDKRQHRQQLLLSPPPITQQGDMDVMGSGGEGFMVKSAGSSNKRFRTKFTQEQKERMLEFAEKIGWRRMRKHDDMALNQFCNEIGVKRKVLQVWMHNNKNANRHRDGAPRVPADGAPPSPPPSAPPHQPVGG